MRPVAEWYARSRFTGPDWVSHHLPFWAKATEPLRNVGCDVLEAGSYEGRSAIAFLELLPRSRIVTIDRFDMPGIEERCAANLASYGDRVTQLKGRAVSHMDALFGDGRQFEVIYLDAGKMREGTFAQAGLAWGLLRTGGVLIFDDLVWGEGKPDRERPGQAIQLFAAAFRPAIQQLPSSRMQLIVRKTADWPIHRPQPKPA